MHGLYSITIPQLVQHPFQIMIDSDPPDLPKEVDKPHVVIFIYKSICKTRPPIRPRSSQLPSSLGCAWQPWRTRWMRLFPGAGPSRCRQQKMIRFLAFLGCRRRSGDNERSGKKDLITQSFISCNIYATHHISPRVHLGILYIRILDTTPV